jgi:sugar/nucleoside kinase (ribokinase family)
VQPFARLVVDGNLPTAALVELLAEPVPLALAGASPAKAALLPDIAALRPRARTTLYLNRREAEALCHCRFPDSRAAATALAARGLAAVVTDGRAPVTAAAPGRLVSIAPPELAAGSSTGAGDVFLAAHLDALEAGRPPEAALRAAVLAAAAHVARSAA